ncbi:MAG: hypothetical protein FJ135_17450 [Deltaproteobacteria bacterium]|nr:hypothetical protein [Deltaproteobacteria bacterium]
MELKDIVSVIKELVLPELKEIRYEQAEIKTALTLTNKRLDDVNTHLADQSRRIDETNKRIDETNKRIDDIREELTGRIDETNKRIDETNKRIDSIQAELSQRLIAVHNDVILRIDKTNDRLNRLYEVIVRRDEHEEFKSRIGQLERDMADIKQRLAA